MSRSPAVILFNADGVALAVSDGVAVPIGTQGLLAAGQADDGKARFLRAADDGTVRTDPTGTTTQPVSAASLPLPTGAATEATLVSIKDTDGIKKITDPVVFDPGSHAVTEQAIKLDHILIELCRIRMLLEHLADEETNERDVQHDH